MTVGLMVAIFYIGYVLTTGSEKTSSVAPRKTKAQSADYSKFVPLNATDQGLISPTLTPTPTIKALAQASKPSITLTPTPTEVILVQQGTTETPTVISTASASATPQAKISSLPKTGFVTNAIVIFGVSALIIFISFIF